MKRKIKKRKNKPLKINKLFWLFLIIYLLLQLIIMNYIKDADTCFLIIIFLFIIILIILFFSMGKNFDNLYYFFTKHKNDNEKYKRIYYELFPIGKYSALGPWKMRKYFIKNEITDEYILNEANKWELKAKRLFTFFLIQFIWINIIYLLFKSKMCCF